MRKKFKYLFRREKKTSANTAKERLQIIISHERLSQRTESTSFMEKLQRDLLEVIATNFKVDPAQIREMVKVGVAKQGANSVIELNITLPENELLAVEA